MPVQIYKEGSTTWVVLKEPVDMGMDWEHLSRVQMIGINKSTAWVGHQKEEWL